MGYKITGGLLPSDLSDWLKRAALKFGTFEDGRVDYTNADIAPIVMCTLIYKNKIFLAKRGFGLADAEGYWSTINGFIDEDKPVNVIATQEFREELQLKVSPADIKIATSYTLKSDNEKRSYIVFPCLLIVESEPTITLDREHTEFAWINRSELSKYHILDDLPKAIDAALALL